MRTAHKRQLGNNSLVCEVHQVMDSTAQKSKLEVESIQKLCASWTKSHLQGNDTNKVTESNLSQEKSYI